MFSSFSGDGEIGISEIHGYKPFGIHNIPLRYTASTIHPQFENEDFISISGVSATKIGPGPLELGYGLDSMLNDLPFFNNGYLGIRESETGLYNFDSSVNDSSFSQERRVICI